MTLRCIRLAGAWLRRQAQQQEARDEWLDHQRRCLCNRVARQPRDDSGRWKAARA